MSTTSAAAGATATVSAEDALLIRVGNGVVHDFVSITCDTALYGMYLVLVAVAIYSFTTHKSWTKRPALPMLAALAFMFGISTFLWASNVALLVMRINIALVDVRLGTLSQRLALTNTRTQTLRGLSDVFFAIEYIVGDAVILWRVFVLYRTALLWVALATSLWLGASGAALGFIICVGRKHFPLTANLPHTCPRLENTSWTLSLAFNALCTGLLAHKAWVHRRAHGRAGTSRTQVERIMLILVVSGAIYVILGAPRLTAWGNAAKLPANVAFWTEIFTFMIYQIVGLYPTIVTLLVLYERALFGPDSGVLSADPVTAGGAGPELRSMRFREGTTDGTDTVGGGWLSTGKASEPHDKEAHTSDSA